MKTLILIDFINEIVHKDGKLSGKGYAEFVKAHNTLQNVHALSETARKANVPVIWVAVQFDQRYSNWPSGSPLFGAAKQYGALQSDTWATLIHEEVGFDDSDYLLAKHRVSAFSNPELVKLLNKLEVTELIVAGVATDLAVSSIVFDAHDLDYQVTVVADSCAAANQTDHDFTLKQVGKIAVITNLDDLHL